MRAENLFVFATEMERDGVFPKGIPQGYDCIVSGVGILSTAINLGLAFQKKSYKNAIQIGIAGAYRSSGLKIAEIVEVKNDCLIEFLPWKPNAFSASETLTRLLNKNIAKKLKSVKGATVLSCAKTEKIGNIRGKIAQVESMEGASFFAVCKEYGIKSAQIRAVSNYAANYQKKEWKIEEALFELRELFNNYLLCLPRSSAHRANPKHKC